jgi:hypothetical protein
MLLRHPKFGVLWNRKTPEAIEVFHNYPEGVSIADNSEIKEILEGT